MAAAVSGAFPVCLDQQRASAEEEEMKKKQMALMEKLRNKRTSQHRSWTDSLMKSVRTTGGDRRLQADGSERVQVQKCLDTLQRAMKVISQQSLVERLDLIARQQGLSFHYNDNDPSVKLQADMFHIEIILNKGGGVKEVKIAHQGDASVCHELTEILGHGDFPEFTSHLEGLQSIYQVTAEKKLKSKAFLALQSLEKDLNSVAQFQTSISGVANYIHKSPLGILLPRTAGKPMKLIYFVSPYDLLDTTTNSAHPMTVEAITEHGLGRSVTVCLEPGPPIKLQTMPLVSFNKTSDGNCLPSFTGLSQGNSALLPAHFVLVLSQPVPIALSLIHKFQTITGLDTAKEMGTQPLLSLILDSNSGGKMRKDQQLYVTLPGQNQLYFINGVSGGPLNEPGVILSRIPFSHPTHVPKILSLLRQQLLFNSILTSCVRPSAKKDPTTNLVFEMTVISLTQMMIVFEHPACDTIVTVDIDMSDITSLKCSLQCSNTEHSICSDDFASRVLQRCLSLPILMRSLVLQGQVQLEKLMAEARAQAEEQAKRAREMALFAAAQARQQQQARLAPTVPTKGRPPPPQPPPPHLTPSYPPTPSPITSNPPSVGAMGGVDLLGSSPPGYPQMDSQDKQNNPLLVTLLDGERVLTASPGAAAAAAQGQGGTMPITESPMLSRLLDDNISVATSITPIITPSSGQAPPKPKGTKGRKRRSQSDMAAGRSPKRLISDSDNSERYGSLDLESSSSPFESSLGGSGGLAGFHHQMVQGQGRPPSQGHMSSSSVIDLTDEHMPNESSLKKLFDMKPGGATPDSELQALLSRQEHSNSPSAGLKPNQVTGPKNENASTSPEGLLIGSGEVGKASLPDPLAVHHHKAHAHAAHTTTSPPTTLAAFLGHGPTAAKARRDSDAAGLHAQPGGGAFLHQELKPVPHFHMAGGVGAGMAAAATQVAAPLTSSRPKVVSSSSMTELLDVKPVLPPGKKGGGLKASASMDPGMDKRGLFEKFDFTGQTASTAHITITSSSVTASSGGGEGEDVPKVRLKLQNFRAPHSKSQSLDSGVVQSPSSAGSKSSNSNTFDFHSDEDDDEAMPINMNYHVAPERLAVYSSSPTRLQISSKGKPPTPVSTPESSPSVKPEKYKRKDKSSGNAKRKKDRDESKKERKKKKLDRDLYQPTGKELTYRASTVETDQKTGTKLKIRVSKELLAKVSSPVKESSRVDLNSEKVGKFSERLNDAIKRRPTPSSPTLEKLILHKQDIKDVHTAAEEANRDRDLAQLYRSSPTGPGRPPKSGSSGKSGTSGSNSALGKADPKLAKATIRLKPLNITSTTSTSVTLSQPTKTTSSSRSNSDRTERRNQSASTPVTTPTSSTLTLSSILPDAPTASSVASLPKIPKVSSQNSNAAATTTTASVSAGGTKSSPALANNSVKSSAINSTFNNSLNKGSGSPGMGAGRSGSNPNIPNATKSPNMGFNKSAGAGGMQKSSPNMPGYKPPGTTTMPPGILKNCGNVSLGGSNSQKTQASGNQGLQKGPGGANQLTGPYNRGPNSSNQTGGSQKSVGPGQGLVKNMPNQVGGAYKTGGVQGSVSRGPNAGTQGLQKGHGGLQKSPNVQNQAASAKLSGSPNHNVGPQKAGVQGKSGGGSPVTGSNKTLAQGANQKNSAQGGNFTSKPQGSATSSQGQVQKLLGNQGRSMSTSSYNSSPNSSGRPGGMVRNNSVAGSGGSGGGRTPPNHLPVNRSASASGQKAGSGSSPRTPAGHSPSNPSAPRFPSNSPGQKNSGASPSSVSQRSGSTPQTSSQRSTSGSNSSQHGANPRSSGVSSQRSSTSPQTLRSALVNPGSSPNQRPASTPGPGSDPRLSSNGPSHSPGYPVRPSSAGPRQTSSPLGSSPLTSNSSGTRTASPSSQAPRGGGGGSGSGVSSLASGQSATGGGGGGGATDKVPLSRQNSRGSLLSPAVSRQNSTASLNPPVVSRQNSSGSANPPVVSKQNSSGSLTAAVSRQNSSGGGKTGAVSRQNSCGGGKTGAVSRQNSASSLNPAVVSKHDAAGAGSRVSVSASRQSSTAGSSVATVSKQKAAGSLHTTSVSQHNSSVSSSALAASRQNSSCSLGTKHTSNGGGGSSSSVSSASRQTASSTTGSTATSRLASSTTMTQASTQSGTVHTSGKPISTSSTTSPSTVLSAAKTSNTGTHNTQRTSSSGVSTGSLASANKTGVSGNKTVTSKAAGAGGVKTSSGGGVGESSGAVTSKGASSAKANTTTTASVNVKSSAATSVTLSSSVSTTSSVATSKGGASSATSAVHAGTSSVTASSAAGLKVQNSVSSSSASSSSAATSTSASTSPSSSSAPSAASSAVNASKAMVAGAARGRKGSLSAIVNKLATKMVAASGAEGGETGEGVTKAAEGLMEVQEEEAEVKAGVKRSASVSGLSPPSGELKIQRMEAHSKAAPGTPTTPTTLTPAHTTPPHTSSLPLAGVERRRSGSVGEQSRELGEVGLDLSLPKDKAKPEGPLAPPRPDSRGRVSPKDSNPARSGSPAVGAEKIGGMKFNGDSSKDKSRSENEVFKVPTPKTTEESEERGSGGGGSGGVGSKFGRTSPVCNAVSRSLPAPGSPLSDASSPENELVIDCEESPSLTNNRPSSASGKAPVTLAPVYPSPKRVSELASESPAAAGRASPGLGSGKSSPTPSARKNSPQLSPHPKPSPSPAPIDTGANSPCEIDDDLMDAALMGFNAS
ncbi:mediator of RNA polymerase II transcription subunit 1-like isoform X2 [Littorina saxatilis]|uniref:Mediator of RNA polymerase II transcription subunit 1 n=1 Tax=Littorina saxatilis TaxID=31220 RepID=A0AAN9GJ70_9CAEN